MKKQLQFIFSLLFIASSFLTLAQVNPIQLGRSSNAFTCFRTGQNQVYADDASKLVIFVHRQDISIWGGGTADNSKLRYDLSTNGGASFTNDIGVLNSINTRACRYPQITGYNISGSTDPFDQLLTWTGPTTTAIWDGFAAGTSMVASGTPNSTENYLEVNQNSYLPSGLCQGLAGEFWMADFYSNNPFVGDSLRLYKGTYNTLSSDVEWAKYRSIKLNHNTEFNGSIFQVSPNMSFSPDGNTGWVAFLGDLEGGADSVYNPVFIKSSDGGANWDTPVEIDLRTIPYIGDFPTLSEELKALWVGPYGEAVSSGRPTCTFDFDITVDANGNPHLFVVVGSATNSIDNNPPQYTILTGLAKVALDITSDDGGASWKAIKIAPIYTLRGEFGVMNPNTFAFQIMDNHTQISRTSNGSHIFFSWVDADTSSIGFGEFSNLEPNLRIAGLRIADGYQTCPKWITNGDNVWNGRALFPSMAPSVLTDAGTDADYKLPIVVLDMLTNDQFAPCQFWYFGNDATLLEADFLAPGSSLNLDSCSTRVMTSIGEKHIQSAPLVALPNPTQGEVTLLLPSAANGELNITIANITGQSVYSGQVQNLQGEVKVDLSSFENGLYFIRLQVDHQQKVFKVIKQ